jgi:hypothetical protein
MGEVEAVEGKLRGQHTNVLVYLFVAFNKTLISFQFLLHKSLISRLGMKAGSCPRGTLEIPMKL